MKESTKVQFLWVDGKKHTVSLNDGKNDIDINEIKKCVKKITDEKEEQCKSIYYFALGLTGGVELSRGIVLGWLLKSIKDNIELKNKTKITVTHSEEEVSDEEARQHVIAEVENFLQVLKEDKEFQPRKGPVVTGDGFLDGTDQY